MKMAIVDDDIMFARKIRKSVQRFEHMEEEVADIYESGKQLLEALEKGEKYDLYFLDIRMPDMGGLELVERIRCLDADKYIVFITSYEQYALSSIKAGAFYYILKEELNSELPRVWKKIRMEEIKKRTLKEVAVGNTGICKKIEYYNILYIGRKNKNVIFYCQGENGVEEYTERKTLKEIFMGLPPEEFAYINSGEIVNLTRVELFKEESVELGCGIKLTCSRRRKMDFRRKLFDYWRKI